jgi:hypothetical protein
MGRAPLLKDPRCGETLPRSGERGRGAVDGGCGFDRESERRLEKGADKWAQAVSRGEREGGAAAVAFRRLGRPSKE